MKYEIIKCNSLIEFIEKLKIEIDNNASFIQIERSNLSEDDRLDLTSFYFYTTINNKIIAINKDLYEDKSKLFGVRYEEVYVKFIKNNYSKVDKILKMKVFL